MGTILMMHELMLRERFGVPTRAIEMKSGADGPWQQIRKESRQSLFVTADELRQRARELTTCALDVLADSAVLQRETAALLEASVKLRTDLREDLVRWAIDGYYAAPA